MTAPLIGIVLLATAAVPLGMLCGLLSADTKWTQHRQELARLTAPLPEVRDDLAEEPVRRVPGKALAAEGYVDTPVPAYEPPPAALLERALAGLRGLDSERVNNGYEGLHRPEKVTGSAAQMAGLKALREATGEFASLVAANWDTGELTALSWRCDVCRGVVADGEKPHDHCEGCGCPCTLVEPLIGRPPLVGSHG